MLYSLTSTPSRLAASSATFSSFVLKPMMMAFDALASSTSLSEIGPTAVWTKSTSTFLLSIWLSEVVMASSEPCTSVLSDQPQDLAGRRRAVEKALQRRALRRDQLLVAVEARRSSPSVLASFSESMTRNSSPADGSPENPTTLTGVDGPADLIGLPRSSKIALTLPEKLPQMNASPALSVPVCTMTVAVGPRPASNCASMTVPRGSAVGEAFRSMQFGLEHHHFEQMVDTRAFGRGDRAARDLAAPIVRREALRLELLS